MAVDSYGLPVEFILTGGEVHDSKAAPDLIEQLPNSEHTVADKIYDSELFRNQIPNKGSIPVIPRKSNSKIGNDNMDWCLYKYCHLFEIVFARLKHYRAIATRYDNLERNYASTLTLGCSLMWLPMWNG